MRPTQLKIFAVLFVCFSFAAWFVTWSSKGEVVLINNASEEVSLATLEMNGETTELGDIKIGKELRYNYKIRKDASVNLIIRFSSGKTIKKEIAYVTLGFDFFDQVSILDTEVKIIKSEVLHQ